MPQVVNVPQGSSSTQQVPLPNDLNWGAYSSSLLIALAQVTFPSQGGSLILTGDVNFGPNNGFLLEYIKSQATSPATVGVLRLGSSDTIAWRNNANTANLLLSVNASDQLTFNGNVLVGASLTLVGDITGSGLNSGTISTTLSTVNTNVGTFGDSTHTTTVAVNGKGLITSINSNLIALNANQITSGTLPGSILPSFSGDLFSSVGTTVLTLQTVNSNAGSFGDSSHVGSFTVNGKGLITSASSTAITFPVASVSAGSGISVSPTTGAVIVTNSGVLSFNARTGAVTPTTNDYSFSQISGSLVLTTQVTGILPAANGGTAITSYTKGDLLVAQSSSVLAKLSVGANGLYLTANSSATNGIDWEAFTTIQQNIQNTNYTFAASDAGKQIYTNVGGITYSMPTNASVPFGIGTTIMGVNNSASPVTITPIAGVTFIIIGFGSVSGNRTLGGFGLINFFKVDTNTWFISGAGIS